MGSLRVSAHRGASVGHAQCGRLLDRVPVDAVAVAAQAHAVAERILDLPDGHEPLPRALAGPPPAPPGASPTDKPAQPPQGRLRPQYPGRRDRFGTAGAPEFRALGQEKQKAPEQPNAADTSSEDRWTSDIPRLSNLKEGYRVRVQAASDGELRDEALSLAGARARVTQLIHRRLDELQTQGRIGWRLFLLLAATLSAFLVCLLMGTQVATGATGGDGGSFEWLKARWRWLQAQSDAGRLAVIAGLLSAAAHDVLNLLRRRSER